jgi:acyl carrier protein
VKETSVEIEITREIRDYIVTTWLSGDARGFDEDTDLQESGILDSFSTMALLAFLDDRFQARLDPADVSSESFRTVRSVARLTSARLSHPHPEPDPSQDRGV